MKFTQHARDACDDDYVAEDEARHVVATGHAHSKDIDDRGERQIGVNFQGWPSGRRPERIRVKVGWDVRYFVVTVHRV